MEPASGSLARKRGNRRACVLVEAPGIPAQGDGVIARDRQESAAAW
jgi:hypothetical protein